MYSLNDMKNDKTKQVNKEKPAFYERRASVYFCNAAGVLSGLFVLASPFFGWRTVNVAADAFINERVRFWDLVRYVTAGNYSGGFGYKVLILFMFFLIMLTGVIFLYFAWRDQLKPGSALKSSFLPDRIITRFRFSSRVAVVILPVIAAFCMKHNQIYELFYEKLNSIYYSWKSMVDMYKQVNGKLSGVHCWFIPGLGCWMFYSGILLFIVAEGLRYVINTLNEDD